MSSLPSTRSGGTVPHHETHLNSGDAKKKTAHLHHASAPLPFFHPTRAEGHLLLSSQSHYHGSAAANTTDSDKNDADADVRWRSRASRKRLYERKPVSVQHDHHPSSSSSSSSSTHGRAGEKKEPEPWSAELRVHRKIQQHHYWHDMHFRVTGDVSFWVAVIFVLGSIAWVINGFLLFMPLVSTTAKAHEYQAAAWAFVGGTLFELGSYLMLVEALNTGHTQLFGPEVEFLIHEMEGKKEMGTGGGGGENGRRKERFRWIGTGSWRDLGYLASAVQMFAATIFWVSTITGLPGVIPGFFTQTSSIAITDVFFWTPQVIGGCGFVLSSLLLMLEEQKRWWMPGVTSVGWHVGLWNLIGAIGFLLCGAFGYASVSTGWVEYQSVLSTFWGSWAFLIGSLLQLAETLVRE